MNSLKIWIYVAGLAVALSAGALVLGCRSGSVAADGTRYPEIERWWR